MIACLLALLLGSTRPIAASPAQQPLAGEVTIRGQGAVGITLKIEQEVVIPDRVETGDYSDFLLEPHGGTFAFASISERGCVPKGFLDNCMQRFAFGEPGVVPPFPYGSDPMVLRPGLLDVFLVSDGPVTLTLRFPSLGGAVTAEARSPIAAAFERIPLRCPASDCSTLKVGGIERSLPSGSFALVTAFTPDWWTARSPDRWQVHGLTGSTLCMYPNYWYPDASPKQDDHPFGCDVDPLYSDGLMHTRNLGLFQRPSWNANYGNFGATYAGVMLDHVGLPEWNARAYFVWVAPIIDHDA